MSEFKFFRFTVSLEPSLGGPFFKTGYIRIPGITDGLSEGSALWPAWREVKALIADYYFGTNVISPAIRIEVYPVSAISEKFIPEMHFLVAKDARERKVTSRFYDLTVSRAPIVNNEGIAAYVTGAGALTLAEIGDDDAHPFYKWAVWLMLAAINIAFAYMCYIGWWIDK